MEPTVGFRLAVALVGYGLGSIPFGLILTRLGGAGDIRAIGSGNIGATNVLRTGRKGLAAATLLLDGLKGIAAVAGARMAAHLWFAGQARVAVMSACIAAVAAVVGHCFPLWLRFQGGKGVSTALGIAFALDWRVGLACAACWLLAARITRISSAGALVAIAALPVLLWVLDGAWPAVAGLAVAVIVFGRHHENIARLRAGTEPRIGKTTSPAPPLT